MDSPAVPIGSPMMLAHAAARATAPGYLVLYRVGEFYEVLGGDATVVSGALGLQLTRRRQKDAADIPMCGIPAGAAGSAINRLLKGGHRVALSEQPGTPSGERPLRLMTPGTSRNVSTTLIQPALEFRLGVVALVERLWTGQDGRHTGFF